MVPSSTSKDNIKSKGLRITRVIGDFLMTRGLEGQRQGDRRVEEIELTLEIEGAGGGGGR